jgi:hypothetical protein
MKHVIHAQVRSLAAIQVYMQTILILITIAAALFIYIQFIHEDPDKLDRNGNPVSRKNKRRRTIAPEK